MVFFWYYESCKFRILALIKNCIKTILQRKINNFILFVGEGIKYSPHSTTPTIIKQQQHNQLNLIDLTKYNIYISGPSGVHVLMTDEVLINIKDESLYTIDIKNEKIFLKSIYKNEI